MYEIFDHVCAIFFLLVIHFIDGQKKKKKNSLIPGVKDIHIYYYFAFSFNIPCSVF